MAFQVRFPEYFRFIRPRVALKTNQSFSTTRQSQLSPSPRWPAIYKALIFPMRAIVVVCVDAAPKGRDFI